MLLTPFRILGGAQAYGGKGISADVRARKPLYLDNAIRARRTGDGQGRRARFQIDDRALRKVLRRHAHAAPSSRSRSRSIAGSLAPSAGQRMGEPIGFS